MPEQKIELTEEEIQAAKEQVNIFHNWEGIGKPGPNGTQEHQQHVLNKTFMRGMIFMKKLMMEQAEDNEPT